MQKDMALCRSLKQSLQTQDECCAAMLAHSNKSLCLTCTATSAAALTGASAGSGKLSLLGAPSSSTSSASWGLASDIKGSVLRLVRDTCDLARSPALRPASGAQMSPQTSRQIMRPTLVTEASKAHLLLAKVSNETKMNELL